MTAPDRKNTRITLRDQMLANQKSEAMYAAFRGIEPRALPIPPGPVKRVTQPSLIPLERDVQKTIIAGLRLHPDVGLVERVNSGTAVEQNADGSKRYIDFHHVYPVAGHPRMRPSDLHVTLRGGRRLAIEVKRPGWKKPTDEREREQAAYLNHIQALGGYGIFATCWEDVALELVRISRCES